LTHSNNIQSTRSMQQFVTKDILYVHDHLTIEMREFLVKGLEVLIWILHVINTTNFSYAMHWQLRCTNIDGADTYPTSKNRTNGWTTRHVIANHKVLQTSMYIHYRLPMLTQLWAWQEKNVPFPRLPNKLVFFYTWAFNLINFSPLF